MFLNTIQIIKTSEEAITSELKVVTSCFMCKEDNEFCRKPVTTEPSMINISEHIE